MFFFFVPSGTSDKIEATIKVIFPC